MPLSRRDFARALALAGSATLVPRDAVALADWTPPQGPLRSAPASPDERFWREVRERFILPRDLGYMNAANLCPTPLPVLEALERNTRLLDQDPSSATRSRLTEGREESRRVIAAFLGVSPEEIVITRNASEANNLISSGLTLGPGDEVLLFSDNHPSNNTAWREKSKRYGFTVVTVEQRNPHPGTDYYVNAFARAITSRTRVLSFTHVTNSVGDVLPAAELCALARERGIMSVVDGAQSFGALAVDLGTMGPDFYSGSAHKWPCGPKETGLLFINKAVHDRVWPSLVSLYPGAVGISRRFEGMGQRDEAALASLGEAFRFQSHIGRAAVEQRGRELTRALMEGLSRLPNVHLWTSQEPARSSVVVTFRPGALDPRRLGQALYERDRIVCAPRTGEDRPGIRLSPHLYNTMDEVERVIAAVKRYLATGV